MLNANRRQQFTLNIRYYTYIYIFITYNVIFFLFLTDYYWESSSLSITWSVCLVERHLIVLLATNFYKQRDSPPWILWRKLHINNYFWHWPPTRPRPFRPQKSLTLKKHWSGSRRTRASSGWLLSIRKALPSGPHSTKHPQCNTQHSFHSSLQKQSQQSG